MVPAIASALIGAGGTLGSGILSGVTNALTASHSTHQQARLMDYQAYLNYHYGKKTALNSPTWNRTGLQNAGYNPMLAVQNATSGVNSNFSGLGNADMAQQGDLLSNAFDFKRLQNESALNESQVKLNEAQGRKVVADAVEREVKNNYLDNREQQEIGKIEAEIYKMNKEADYTQALKDNIQNEMELRRYLGELDYDAKIYGANTAYNATSYSANKAFDASRENNIWRTGALALGSLAIPGFGALKALKGAKTLQQIKKFKKLKKSADYYKDFSTLVH